jgi:MFS family permease
MLEGFIRFLKELDKRVKVALVGTGIYNVGQWFVNQYSTLYAQSLGATGADIGSLNSIASAAKLIFSIPLGSATERYSIKKIMLLGFIFDIIASSIFIMSGNWWTLVPAFILSGKTLITIMPLTDAIFITVTEPEKRSTVMSLSRVFWGMLNLIAPMSAAYIVANSGGINAQGIRPLYYLQLALYVFVFFFITKELGAISSRNNGEKDSSSSKGNSIIQNYREFFKEKEIKRWVVIRIVSGFGGAFSVAFIPLWMVNVKGATPEIIGIFGTLSIVVSVILTIPVGRLADKIGRKKAFYLFAPFAWVGGILLITAPRPEYMLLSGIIGAGGAMMGTGIGGVSFVPFITMWWEQIPAEKRGRGWGIDGLVVSGTAIPASIIAGILWDQGFMVAVLLLPALLEALVVVPLLLTVPDTLGSKR